MSEPPPAAAPDDEDGYAQLLLADALGHFDDLPGMGEHPTTPETGETMTQPSATAPGTTAPAQPAGQNTPPGTPQGQPGAPGAGPGQPQTTQPPAGQGQQGTGAPQGAQPAATGGQGGENLGFPANTPPAQMAPEEQAAYWKHHSRKHEDRVKSMADYEALKEKADQYDALAEASRTEAEKAVIAAREEGRKAALSEVGGRLVEAELRVAVGNRLDKDGFQALIGGLDKTAFLAKDGQVDTDKVSNWVNTVLPAPASTPAAQAGGTPQQQQQPGLLPGQAALPPGGPDFGQGTHASAPPNPLEAGRAAARARHPQPAAAPAAAPTR